MSDGHIVKRRWDRESTIKLAGGFTTYFHPQRTIMNKKTSQPSSEKPKGSSTTSVGLPPIIGMVGSGAFFVTLFSLANTNQEGYDQFRKCHGNCVNGILHFVGMPLAVSGVFLIVRSVSDNAEFTRHLSFIVMTRYLCSTPGPNAYTYGL